MIYIDGEEIAVEENKEKAEESSASEVEESAE